MRLHQQPPRQLMKPTAAVTISYVNKIHRPVVFARPLFNFNFPHLRIHQHQAPGTQEWRHSSVCQPDISVTMLRSFSFEGSFKVSPPFHHPGKKIRAPRIKSWIKPQRHTQSAWRRSDMCSKTLKIDSRSGTIIDGTFKSSQELQPRDGWLWAGGANVEQAGTDIYISIDDHPAAK